jgi:Ran GTPase-activating protein (RanGAP) involved in mRNA processing and transport
VAKALWDNKSLEALDVSHCSLDDIGGSYLARVLKQNSTLHKVEMGSNNIGPKTCKALADSLMVCPQIPWLTQCETLLLCMLTWTVRQVNTTLRHLDLQSTLLTAQGHDLSGWSAFCDMLRTNTSLTSLNLYRCELGEQVSLWHPFSRPSMAC